MSVAELQSYIGQTGTMLITEVGSTAIRVPVQVINVRNAFGRIDLQVTPVGGTGRTWIDSYRFTKGD